MNTSSVAPAVSAPRHDFTVVSSDDIYTGKVLAVRRDVVLMAVLELFREATITLDQPECFGELTVRWTVTDPATTRPPLTP